MSEACIFCRRDTLQPVGENAFAFAIRDKYPISDLHTLVLPKRHVETPFELTSDELVAIFLLADDCRNEIVGLDTTVGGLNFGANVGRVAGQTIMHAHFHLIPRRAGDIAPPPAIGH